jgi:hypothetical protein
MSDNIVPSEHESGLRRLLAEAEGLSYRAFRSLDEARRDELGAVILEGDDGGQIYATCPASRVGCSQAALEQLLHDVDDLVWRDPRSSRLCFERLPVGSAVPGGMGGGRIEAAVWVHEDLTKLGVDEAIQDVVEGRRGRLLNTAAGK